MKNETQEVTTRAHHHFGREKITLVHMALKSILLRFYDMIQASITAFQKSTFYLKLGPNLLVNKRMSSSRVAQVSGKAKTSI